MEKFWKIRLEGAASRYRDAAKQLKDGVAKRRFTAKKKIADMYLKEWQDLTQQALNEAGEHQYSEIGNWMPHVASKYQENFDAIMEKWQKSLFVDFQKSTSFAEKALIYRQAPPAWFENPHYLKSMIKSIKESFGILEPTDWLKVESLQEFRLFIKDNLGKDSFHYHCVLYTLGEILLEQINTGPYIHDTVYPEMYKLACEINKNISPLQRAIIDKFLSNTD